MIARALTLGLVSASLFVGFSVGDNAHAARKAAAGKCMEAVMPKCGAGQHAMCAKQSKCKSCAKWSCTTTKKILPFLM
jgi:hypothetical protein